MEPLRKIVNLTFEEALAKVPDALKTEGFGVLTEIDVQATLKKKLGADFRPYRILGACNPPFAKKALEANLEIGRMMPCNVVVYVDDAGKTVVSAVDPTQSMLVAGETPELRELATAVREKLGRALALLG